MLSLTITVISIDVESGRKLEFVSMWMQLNDWNLKINWKWRMVEHSLQTQMLQFMKMDVCGNFKCMNDLFNKVFSLLNAHTILSLVEIAEHFESISPCYSCW